MSLPQARRGPLVALLVLSLLVLVPASPAGASEALPMPRPGSVWTVFTTVEAVVDDNYAVVNVIADIANRGPDPEFPFRVRVPDGAFVTGLTIERDGVVHEARIADRAEARAEYEETKRREETGGLVEKERGSSVYAFLINVAEFTNVRATLTYETYLLAEEGVHTLPLEAPVSGFGEDLGARFEVLVRAAEGVTDAWGTPSASLAKGPEGARLTYSVGPRRDDASTPFTASYLLPPTPEAGSILTAVADGKGYFAHRFRATRDAEAMPIDLVLVLDVSGSMSGLKIQQLQDAATQVLGALRAEDRLHLVFFSSEASSPWRGLKVVDASARQEAARAIKETLASGGTNIEAGIERGFGAYAGLDLRESEGRLPILVFLTDGQPTMGATDRADLRKLAREANAQGASVFALAFGRDADWSLVHGLAKDGAGVALRVPEGAGAEVDLRRFIVALTTPVLKNVRVEYGQGVIAIHRTAPVLFAGSELLLVGTFDAGLREIAGTVSAWAPDGARAYPFRETLDVDGGAGFLPRLVAYHEIRHLQELVSAEGERADWVARVKALALAHGFVTDYTSLVLSLDPRPADRGAPPPEGIHGSSAVDPRGMPYSQDSYWTDLRTGTGSGGAQGSSGAPAPDAQSAVPGPGALAALLAGFVAVAIARRARRPQA